MSGLVIVQPGQDDSEGEPINDWLARTFRFDVEVNTGDLLFSPIWEIIKGWDIQRQSGSGYARATGTDVQLIINAIREVERVSDSKEDK